MSPVEPAAPPREGARREQPEVRREKGDDDDDDVAKPDARPSRKPKYERPARTGREVGMTTLFFNVGRKQLVTPADIVGKIAGVTGLPADVVGAIDIHQRHTLVDVAQSEAALIVKKLGGIRLKGVALAPMQAENETTI